MLEARLDDGRLTFTAAAPVNVLIRGAAPALRAWRGGQRLEWIGAPLVLDQGCYRASNAVDGFAIALQVERAGGAYVLRATLTNSGPTPIRVADLAPLCVPDGGTMIGAGADRWSVFRNGYQSWSGTGSYRAVERDLDPRFGFLRVSQVDLRHRSRGRPGVFRSDGFSAIKNLRSGEALVCGFLDARHAFGGVEVDVSGGVCRRLRAASDCDDRELAPGQSMSSEPLWLAASGDAAALLRAYAIASGERMQARVRERAPRGWCSWYYYFQNVTESHVLENVAALQDLRVECPCDYVLIDDGYQRAVGDWLESNAKFPHGMSWLGEQIRRAGFAAGIWLAPFIARPESRLYREHPDWFVRTDDGKPRAALWNPTWGWKGRAYALDTTHPAVLGWLEQLGATLAGTWRYQILKLDFLFAAALPGVRYDTQATRAQSLRRGLEALRRGAGDEAFLIGCGCPLMPAVGVVDAMRIGPDVAPFWTNWLSRGPLRDRHGVSTKHAIRNTLTRAWLHRAWWLNDPDCVMVRERRTQLTYAEVRTLATVIALTDGLFVMSDRMDRLPPERRGLLIRAQELLGGRSEVIDLFEKDLPELLYSRRDADSLLGVFNFRDESARKVVDVSACGLTGGIVTDVWSGAQWPVRDGWLDFGVLPAHGSMTVRWKNSPLDGGAS
jgi:alpha-galactosidase